MASSSSSILVVALLPLLLDFSRATENGNLGSTEFRGGCKVDGTICQFSSSGSGKGLTNCAMGFAGDVTGGASGISYVVTDSSDTVSEAPARGTLRYGLEVSKNNSQCGGAWITFARDMEIDLAGTLLVPKDTTIDGRGAYVGIHGHSVEINRTGNIIIHNVELSNVPSDEILRMYDGSSKVWIDHVTMSQGEKGLVKALRGTTDVTVSNCVLENDGYQYNMVFGGGDDDVQDTNMRVTVYRNWIRNSVQGMPRVRFGYVHVANNFYSDWRDYAIEGTHDAKVVSQSNVFEAGRSCEVVFGGKEDTATIQSMDDILLNGATFSQRLPSGPLPCLPYESLSLFLPLQSTESVCSLVKQCAGALCGKQLDECIRLA